MWRSVVVREGQHLEPKEIIGFCRERLANHKVPKSVRILQTLPKNASGKVLKRELREHLPAAQRSRATFTSKRVSYDSTHGHFSH
ncbi:MAG: hypothetical protein ABI862_14610 [Ilumatobacteraceae bacterium]